ncbi:hypothetical protein B0T26DRAFT_649853 [Lasiosphaeria miniovina]|uniref:DNA polymerase kappa n=1 Tax=Lasiosphaeria miniovina TaxID=1954250 RepID=A0AA40ADP2_9PEZI|nr:uncharacterized protein B0T26DRAFT_649853 [Lasiosphaeria miniovina]KAK0713874.1 hypothetical protein B0T26DRAFT_649853 [Lasiosphaeria miniovina]
MASEGQQDGNSAIAPEGIAHASLKYSLLGPSLTKAGQESVDQSKACSCHRYFISNASKGSKYFTREEAKDKVLTAKIEQMLAKKSDIETLDLSHDLRAADSCISQLEIERDLTQHIVHIDCDAFYAAVELLDRPELENLPFAVGGGVLTTCNYVARRFGCRSGMAGFVAKKLCPELVLLPLNFNKYNAKAAEVRDILSNYDARFESASIDEAFLNITEYCMSRGTDPANVVDQMRKEIYEKTHITVSAGIAANTRLAKICSNINKPNGQFVLPRNRTTIMAFMHDLPCRKVNGVGRVLERELASVGIKTCGDIYPQRQYLNRLFGEKTSEFLLCCYLGLGRTSIQPAEEYDRKSVGTESTFRDMGDPTELRDKLRSTADELEKDMRRAECKGRTLCLKVKLHTYEVLTRQVVTPKAVYLAEDLYRYSLPMLVRLEQEFPCLKLRLMGLRCTHLVSAKKPDTRAFFGLKPEKQDRPRIQRTGTEEEWEQWPENYLDIYSGVGRERTTDSRRQSSDDDDSFHRRGNETPPDPEKNRPASAEEWWDCPICARPQPADERIFNEHIDLCLSRRVIRDTVQQDAVAQPPNSRGATPESKKPKEKKRGRQSTMVDPKQKRLCFG